MMTQSNFVPDVVRLQKAIAESRQTRQDLAQVSLDLDELIVALEQHNLTQRQRLRQKHAKA